MIEKETLTEAFEYLDELRESGRTNMWGAASFIASELFYDQAVAKESLLLWMETFDGESTVAERVEKALGKAP